MDGVGVDDGDEHVGTGSEGVCAADEAGSQGSCVPVSCGGEELEYRGIQRLHC